MCSDLRRLNDLCLVADVATGVEDDPDLTGYPTRACRVIEKKLPLGLEKLVLEHREAVADNGGKDPGRDDVPLEAPEGGEQARLVVVDGPTSSVAARMIGRGNGWWPRALFGADE